MATPDVAPTTPRALTVALRAAGSLPYGDVVDAEITKQGATAISYLWWLTVDYSAGSGSLLPRRLLVKCPLDRSAAPDRGGAETAFYRDLAPALRSPPVVRCLAVAPPDGDQQWLVLEDLRSSHASPPWPGRPTDDELLGAVAVLAQLHAQWWDSSGTSLTFGAPHTETSLRGMVHDISAHLPAFVQHLGDDLSAADRSVLETVFSSSLRPWLRLADDRGLTVVHGDAHTWNFLFPRSGNGVPFLIDWQTWHRDVGARDLAFLMALHWDPPTRQRLELTLLQQYHRELMRAGVTTCSFDDLLLEYRRCVVRNLTFPIIFWWRGFPRETWRGRLDCALAAYRDLDAAELL